MVGVIAADKDLYTRIMPFDRVYQGVQWEQEVGYCRALRAGATIHVAGTAPVAEDGSVSCPGDAYGQAARCLELIDRAVIKLGGLRSHIVRTRMFVTDINRWAEFGRAHQEFFGSHHPATSMVEVNSLIDPTMLIEIEADAICCEE